MAGVPVIALTLGEVAAALGVELPAAVHASATITGRVVVDSRIVGPGDLFVALSGEHADGHDFVAAAIGSGAVAAVVDGARADLPDAVPLLRVTDPLRALGTIARAVLDQASELIAIGITGSNGKTTTKEMLAGVLEHLGPTVATEGNLNNELGVPSTALRVDPATRFLVSEMGARSVGDIGYLAGIVRPDIGVVLNVGTAHLGEFGSRAAIASAKGEMVEALSADGVAVLNADDQLVAAMESRSAAPVVTFGRGDGADVRAENVVLDDRGRAGFELVAEGDRAPVQLGYVGEHHVANALAAAAAALAVRRVRADGPAPDVGTVAAALSDISPVARWRMQVTDRTDGVTIVNDAYNASPDSMAAAIVSLTAIGRGRRTFAVLGEMLELGEASAAEHEQLGRLTVRSGVDVVLAVGPGAAPINDGARAEGAVGITGSRIDGTATIRPDGVTSVTMVADRAAAGVALANLLRPGDVVLVKSSRDAGLRWLGDELAAVGQESNESADHGTGGRD